MPSKETDDSAQETPDDVVNSKSSESAFGDTPGGCLLLACLGWALIRLAGGIADWLAQ
jgi:hypothetical protein